MGNGISHDSGAINRVIDHYQAILSGRRVFLILPNFEAEGGIVNESNPRILTHISWDITPATMSVYLHSCGSAPPKYEGSCKSFTWSNAVGHRSDWTQYCKCALKHRLELTGPYGGFLK